MSVGLRGLSIDEKERWVWVEMARIRRNSENGERFLEKEAIDDGGFEVWGRDR